MKVSATGVLYWYSTLYFFFCWNIIQYNSFFLCNNVRFNMPYIHICLHVVASIFFYFNIGLTWIDFNCCYKRTQKKKKIDSLIHKGTLNVFRYWYIMHTLSLTISNMYCNLMIIPFLLYSKITCKKEKVCTVQ